MTASQSRQTLESRMIKHAQESLLQRFEMTSDSGPHHDAVEIDGLAVLAVTLPGQTALKKPCLVKTTYFAPGTVAA